MEKTEKIFYPGNPNNPGDDYVINKKYSIPSPDRLETETENIIRRIHRNRKREKEKKHERVL